MRNENERKLSSPSLDFDVGLGLKLQQIERDNMASPLHQYQQFTSSSENNANLISFSGDGGGGGPILNQVAGGSYIYEAANDGSVLPMSFHNSGYRASGMYGKGPFTGSQLQELERQKIIHKYMVSSVPVPPQLMFPISRTAPSSNTTGLDLRFGSSGGGSDPEPWRCKRTDGKKWRCSRDVTPHQRYCERHAHKNKTRSRKHVELPSHKTTPPALQKPSSLYATTPYEQTRCFEWFMRGGGSSSSSSSGAIPASTTCNQQQWQEVMLTSSLSNKDNRDQTKNLSVYRPQYEEDDKQVFTSSIPLYVPDTIGLGGNHHQHQNLSNELILDSLNSDKTQATTRHFIDALGKKFSPSSSLSLSMSGYDHEDNNENGGWGNRDSDESLKSEWLNSVSWMNSTTPGGPLGEALCLGNASSTNKRVKNSNLEISSHGYNNNSNNSNTKSSKSSYEDCTHAALNFIG